MGVNLAQLFRIRHAALIFGTVVAVLTALAIFGFGAPATTLAVVAWLSIAAYGWLSLWAERRLGRP